MTTTCTCKEKSCTYECTEQHTHSKFFCEKCEPVVTPHDCEQNIESNMTPAHCAVGDKSLVTPDTEWDIVREAHMFLPLDLEGREEFLQSLEQLLSSRDTYWKERVRKEYQAIKETPAYVNLMTQWGQLDEDGVCIAVSRQALEETTQALDTLLDNLK